MSAVRQAFERLAKWRSVFTGWQLGTRLSTDPEAQAVRDHREVTMFLRVEVTGLTRILLEKGIVTSEELDAIMGDEADRLSAMYEKKFPGMKAQDYGMSMTAEAAETMKGWKP